MIKIKLLVLLLALSSCNQYLGTIDPDYTPINEVTEIFSVVENKDTISEINFGNIIFPKNINPSISENFKIDKIINTDKNSVLDFLYGKIILSKGENIHIIDNKDKNNNLEYKLDLKKEEKVLYFFGYKNKFHILTNRSRIFVIDGQNIIDSVDYDIFTNSTPILLGSNLIIFSVFGDIHKIKLEDNSISKIDNFNSKPGITIKSNIFEDRENLYYLFNSGTLVTISKNNNDYYKNYILEDLNILSSLGVFDELIDSPFTFNEYLYFLDRSGKIAVYNPLSSDILWERDINQTILSYLFSKDGYLIIMTIDKILFLSKNGNLINTYKHNTEMPISIFSIKEYIYLIFEKGISKLNLNDKSEDSFYENKFTTNLEIYYQDQNIFLKDDKSLFKLSE